MNYVRICGEYFPSALATAYRRLQLSMVFSINSRVSLYRSSHIIFNNTRVFKATFSPHDTPSLSFFQRELAGETRHATTGLCKTVVVTVIRLTTHLWPLAIACWPKWVQSRELDAVHDNHLAKPCIVYEDSELSGHPCTHTQPTSVYCICIRYAVVP